VIERLVSQGATVNVKNRRGQTPLKLADAPRRNRGGDVFAGHTETVKLQLPSTRDTGREKWHTRHRKTKP